MEWELQQTRAQAETRLADMQLAQRAYTDVQSMMAIQLSAWEQANSALGHQLHEVLQTRDMTKGQNDELVKEKISVWPGWRMSKRTNMLFRLKSKS